MPSAPKLSYSVVQEKLATLPTWSLENGEITRTYQLPSFPSAIVFVAAVAQLAEAADHHPDILIKWRDVKLTISTHSSGGLTEKDFALAAQIDALPQRKEPAKAG